MATKQEISKVMLYIAADKKLEVTKERVDVWHDQFQELDYQVLFNAARILVARKTFGAPCVADMWDAINELKGGDPAEVDAEKAFIRLRMLCNCAQGIYKNNIEIYKSEFPIGFEISADFRRKFNYMTPEQIDSEKHKFISAYKASVEKNKNEQRRPIDLRPGGESLKKLLADTVESVKKLA